MNLRYDSASSITNVQSIFPTSVMYEVNGAQVFGGKFAYSNFVLIEIARVLMEVFVYYCCWSWNWMVSLFKMQNKKIWNHNS